MRPPCTQPVNGLWSGADSGEYIQCVVSHPKWVLSVALLGAPCIVFSARVLQSRPRSSDSVTLDQQRSLIIGLGRVGHELASDTDVTLWVKSSN